MLAYSVLTAFFLIGSTVSVIFLVAEYRRPGMAEGRNHPLRKTPFFVASYVYVETRSVKTEDGKETDLYENTYYLGVGNDEPNGKNLKKVQVRLFGYDLATQTTLLNAEAENEIDLRHGEIAYFKIGRVISKQVRNITKGSITVSDKTAEMYLHNLSLGSSGFEIWNTERKSQFGLNGRRETSGESMEWPLGALITADDTKSVSVVLKIDFANEKELVSIADGDANAKAKK